LGILQLGDEPLVSIKKSLENIQKDIHKLVNSLPRLKVDTYTSKDRAIEQKRMNSINKSQQKK